MFTEKQNPNLWKSHLKEPIIISGKYFSIKLLTVYDFILCAQEHNKLMNKPEFKSTNNTVMYKIFEYACIVAASLYSCEGVKIFSSATEAMKNLTPQELKTAYDEYVKLHKKVQFNDSKSRAILAKVKNYWRKNYR